MKEVRKQATHLAKNQGTRPRPSETGELEDLKNSKEASISGEKRSKGRVTYDELERLPGARLLRTGIGNHQEILNKGST